MRFAGIKPSPDPSPAAGNGDPGAGITDTGYNSEPKLFFCPGLTEQALRLFLTSYEIGRSAGN